VLLGSHVRRRTPPVGDRPDVQLELGRANPLEWTPRYGAHTDAELLKQFSFQRRSRSLTRFDMAAGKIPDVRVPPAVWRPVAQENPTVLDQHAGHDRLSHRRILDPPQNREIRVFNGLGWGIGAPMLSIPVLALGTGVGIVGLIVIIVIVVLVFRIL
jgi:hypothetical protein